VAPAAPAAPAPPAPAPAAEATTATTATVALEPVPSRPRALIFAPLVRDSKGAQLDPLRVRAFRDGLWDVAEGILRWRRLEPIQSEACPTAECVAKAVARAGASLWVSSEIATSPDDPSCRARASSYDGATGKLLKTVEDQIRPCLADQILATAEEFGRRLAEGPRAPLPIALALTPLSVPSLDIPDIPDVKLNRTSTEARARSAFDLGRALEVYRTQHMFLFEEDDGRIFVARNGRLLDDCDVMKVASQTVPPKLDEFCHGNMWELAWLGVPLGAVITLVGATDHDSVGGPVTLLVGLSSLIVSPILALLLNVDAADVQRGEHLATRSELEALIANSNEALRRSLGIGASDVGLAGMRP
jgi:hypothetical protein